MRLSRNRNWGNPALIAFLERFARSVPDLNGRPGLLVGDVSQPRGGPMITGDGCDASLANRFRPSVPHSRIDPDAKPPPPLTMARLPPACRQELIAQ